MSITRKISNAISYDDLFVLLTEGDLDKDILRKILTKYKLMECKENKCYDRRPMITWFSFEDGTIYKNIKKYYQVYTFLLNTMDKLRTITLKDNLFYNMKKYFPHDYKKYIPDAFYLTQNYKLPENTLLIARPTIIISGGYKIPTSSGVDIFVIHNNESLTKTKELLKTGKYQNILLSYYIANPLLFKGKKCHLRMYYFATINNNIFRTYLLNFGFIYTALLPYVKSDYSNKDIHDTHWGSTEKDYYYPKDLMYLGKDKIDYLNNQMRTILYKSSVILYGEKVNNFENAKNSCHVFGVDFMIKDNFDVMLIEINKYPGYKHKNKNDLTLDNTIYSFFNKISFKPLFTNTDPEINNEDISTIPLFVKKINY
jgi:hypothetical protein